MHTGSNRTTRERRSIAEQLLVCIGTSPYSERLIRLAHDRASRQHTTWHAAYVETLQQRGLSRRSQDRVWSALQLAESLGATTSILAGPSAVDAIIDYAQEHGVTEIIVGNAQRPSWLHGFAPTVVDRLLRFDAEWDLVIVNHRSSTEPSPPARQRRAHRLLWKQHLVAVGLVTLATAIGLPTRGLIAPSDFITAYLLALVVAAVYLPFCAAALTAILSVLAFDYFYLSPYYQLALSDIENLLPLVGFMAVGGVISTLVRRSRQQTRAARQRESHTHALYLLSRDLASATDLHTMLAAILEHWQRIFGGRAAILLPDQQGDLTTVVASVGLHVSPAVALAARCAFLGRPEADPDSQTHRDGAAIRHIPLKTAHGIVGVLSVSAAEDQRAPGPEHERVMEVFSTQVALAIERAQLEQQAHEAQILKATEKLQSAILNSVSHDLRTPLSAITGVLSTLHDEASLLDTESEHELVLTALAEAQRLNHLVHNLLDISRIEADALVLTQDQNDVGDLIGTVLVGLEQRLDGRPIEVRIPESLPLVPMDIVLMGRVLSNLLDNADKYAPPGTPIEIEAGVRETWLDISVSDRGPGIARHDLERVFEKFYRSRQHSEATGTGLGLAISKGIVDAHGGRIRAENRCGGGTRVTLCIPLAAKPPILPEEAR